MQRTLDDAAALLVGLDAGDREGAAELADLLQEVGASQHFPLAIQDHLGRAVWTLLDMVDGKLDGAAALEEVGRLLDAALSDLPESGHPAPPSSDPMPADEVPSEPEPTVEAPIVEALVAEVAPTAPSAQPEPAPSETVVLLAADADVELLPDFLAESKEYVTAAEASLLALETDPRDSEAINTIFRAFHTVKGTSAFLGIAAVTELAHRAESFFTRIRSGEIVCTGGYADLSLRAVDVIKEMLELVRATPPGIGVVLPTSYHDLMRALDAPEQYAASVPPAQPTVQEEPAEPAALSASAQAAGAAVAATQGEGSVRVRTDRLDRLIDMIGELVIAQAMVSQDEHVAVETEGEDHELLRKVTRAGKIVRELQDLSLSMRMVPLRPTFQKLARAARDVARISGKQVDLVVEGEDTELDRNMVDVVADPLLHMVRNAIDHGVEAPDERARLGKPATGTVRVRAYHAGGSVVVQMSDDGKGLDRDRILAKARERGLVPHDAQMSDGEIFALIFEPGFSTAERVTDLSGRGVGMDVVKRATDSLRARIEVASERGRGTTFTLRLPLTLAITDGMLVRVGSERYVVPTINIHQTFQPAAEQLSTLAGRGELVMLRNELLPLFRLHNLFAVDGATEDPRTGLLVVFDDGDRRCAMLVDELLGQQQVVAKSLGPYLGNVEGVSGSAILGDGRVGLILDPVDILALARRLPTGKNGHAGHANGVAHASLERSTPMTNGSTPGVARVGGGKFLTFFLADEEYGLQILKVQEIIGLMPITKVPRTPSFIRGVVNLRGKVIPVTDLRLKFGLDAVEPTAETCIIVVRANDAEVGLIVDKVSEVLDIAHDQIDPPPVFGTDVDVDYILGIGKAEGQVKLLLDIDRVLSTQDVIDLRIAAAAGHE